MTNYPDPSKTRVGRCNTCRNRPAYNWPVSSGLRLDDVRCPRCNALLDRTSREAWAMRALTTEEVAEQTRAAIIRLERQLDVASLAIGEWTAERDRVLAAGEDTFAADLSLDRYSAQFRQLEASRQRILKAWHSQTAS